MISVIMKRYLSKSEAQTRQIAIKLAAKIHLPAMVCLYGDLGSGKTVFTKGLAQALGISPKIIKSPTFTLQRQYLTKQAHLYHFDFYRVSASDELIGRDLIEALEDPIGLVVAEWADNVKDVLPKNRIDIQCKYIDENTREFIINSTKQNDRTRC